MICVPAWARAVCWSSAGDPGVRTEMTAAVEVGRIRSLETFHDQYVCFVRLTTTLGQVGWGQRRHHGPDLPETSDIGGLITTIEEREHKYRGSYRCRALAGLDTALWDLHGRATGRPTARPARVRPSWWTPTAASLRAGRSRSAGSGGAEGRPFRGTGRRERLNAAHQIRNPASVRRRREPAPVREVRQSAWHNYAMSAASPAAAHRRRSGIDLLCAAADHHPAGAWS